MRAASDEMKKKIECERDIRPEFNNRVTLCKREKAASERRGTRKFATLMYTREVVELYFSC